MKEQLLTHLKMKGALEALPHLEHLKERDPYLNALLQAELHQRETRATKRRLSQAKFPTEKEWIDLDPSLNPKINFEAVKQLSDGRFIEKKENLCLMGQQGTGKTLSLTALGRELCRRGKTVLFQTATEIVNLLDEAKANHTLRKAMKTYLNCNLLIIDELGYVPLSEGGARLLFDVFASRYEKGSIAVSTNLSYDKWSSILGTPELTVALIDRFSHRCNTFSYEGTSVRYLEAKKRKEAAQERT